jgi:hypothetical protein
MNERLSLILIRLIFKSYIYIFQGKSSILGAMGNKCFFFRKRKKKLLNSSKYALVNKLFKFRRLLYLSDHILINCRVWVGWPSFRTWRYLQLWGILAGDVHWKKTYG